MEWKDIKHQDYEKFFVDETELYAIGLFKIPPDKVIKIRFMFKGISDDWNDIGNFPIYDLDTTVEIVKEIIEALRAVQLGDPMEKVDWRNQSRDFKDYVSENMNKKGRNGVTSPLFWRNVAEILLPVIHHKKTKNYKIKTV